MSMDEWLKRKELETVAGRRVEQRRAGKGAA